MLCFVILNFQFSIFDSRCLIVDYSSSIFSAYQEATGRFLVHRHELLGAARRLPGDLGGCWEAAGWWPGHPESRVHGPVGVTFLFPGPIYNLQPDLLRATKLQASKLHDSNGYKAAGYEAAGATCLLVVKNTPRSLVAHKGPADLFQSLCHSRPRYSPRICPQGTPPRYAPKVRHGSV